MTELVAKAIDFAQETTKQLLTLGAAILGLTITFLHDIASGASKGDRYVLDAAWIAYLVSVAAGVVVLQALTAELQPSANELERRAKTDDEGEHPSIWNKAIRRSAMVQAGTFLLAIILTVIFGWLVASPKPSSGTPKPITKTVTTTVPTTTTRTITTTKTIQGEDPASPGGGAAGR